MRHPWQLSVGKHVPKTLFLRTHREGAHPASETMKLLQPDDLVCVSSCLFHLILPCLSAEPTVAKSFLQEDWRNPLPFLPFKWTLNKFSESCLYCYQTLGSLEQLHNVKEANGNFRLERDMASGGLCHHLTSEQTHGPSPLPLSYFCVPAG